MKNCLVRITALLSILSMCLSVLPAQRVMAASANVSFFAKEEPAEAGSELTVTLEITSDTVIGDFEAYFTYNPELMEYVDGPACITGGDGYLKVSDIDAASSVGKRNYVMTFRALKHGVCKFQISGVPMVYAYENGNSMSVMSESYSLVIEAPVSASDNALLSTLRVSPGNLTPAFLPEITEYEVSVGNDVERMVVSAVPQDMAASVSVTGNSALTEGENHINITVTAENGTVKTYHILAVRSAKDENITPEVTGTPQETDENKALYLSVSSEGRELLCGSFRYQLSDNAEGLEIPQEYQADVLLVDGHQVPVYMKSKDADSCLMILINAQGERGLYRLDRKEYTVQRYSPEIITVTDTSDIDRQVRELMLQTEEYEKKKNRMSLLCGAMGVVIALLAVFCIRLFIRSRGFGEEDF